MALLDHFRPPLSGARHWESFHSTWAGSMADVLNSDLLPPGYFAEEHVHVGSRVEVDVATFDDRPSGAGGEVAGAVAVAAPAWVVPAPPVTWPAVFPDSVEVLVFRGEGGPVLVAAIELVSPGNKDRPEHRRAFAAKCASYLQQGVGLIVVDIVTARSANLHNELGAMLGVPAASDLDAPLYAVAYRPVRRPDDERIDVWPTALAIGQPLPALPLALDHARVVQLDLEATYTRACERRRIAQYPRPVG